MSEDALERLARCHERIEAELGRLEDLARHMGSRGVDSLAQASAKEVLHYFETSGARHHEDEDGDLFPLLRLRAAERGREEVAAGIDELEREHGTMHTQWRRLRDALEAIVAGRERALDEDVERFAWLYRRHMDREGVLVLPFAKEALTVDERSDLSRRMEARRRRPR